MNGFQTMDPRRTPKMNHNKKFYRKSSLDNNTLMSPMTRTERIQVVLDCTHGSGLCLSMTPQGGSGFIVTKILQDSVAERSGCIQKGDRIVAVNKLYNLDIQLIRQIMRDTPTAFLQQQQQQNGTAHWVELELEFDMVVDDSSRGIFNIKLMKARNSGLGVTVNGENLFFIFAAKHLNLMNHSQDHHMALLLSQTLNPVHRHIELQSKLVILSLPSIPIQFNTLTSMFC
jgi:glutamate receptor-interacting protein